ncbi:carbonic anhydrase [Microdochium trichocladiopsis]|uniref:Carbonic anhydrase n=1 Tax=Microdochium trichocladiopsis TaxID=1682393 RepID=A0A9P8YDF3_9PEZI|nr:carbonic anhydrase [Microdochium trichocladiopsis]KAH7035890.1 carbonic anhydrase [Microdochium trichocladiopsis]
MPPLSFSSSSASILRGFSLLTSASRHTTSRSLASALPAALPRFNTHTTALRYCSSHSSSSSSAPTPSTPTNTRSYSLNAANMSGEDIDKYLKHSHDKVFEYNQKWAEQKAKDDPEYFTKLSAGQTPEYLYIGCSDSRIPFEQISGLQPGEAFIHRNIANLVVNADLNVMSVINYAVRHLEVKHIVVCGHYGCGGVKAAMTPKDLGLLNPWLRNIRDVYRLHEKELDDITDEPQRYNRLVELSVLEQCRNVIKTAAVQQSYAKKKFPVVHGWVFNFENGLIKDLKIDFEGLLHDIQKIYNLTE